MRLYQCSGLTLLELIFVLAIVFVVVAVGVPSMHQWARETRLAAAQRQLFTALHYTRNHAIQSGSATAICARSRLGGCAKGGGQWSHGWIVFEAPEGVDDCSPGPRGLRCTTTGNPVLRLRKRDPGDGPEIINNHNVRKRVRYDGMGLSYGYTGRFTLCPQGSAVEPKGLVIANTGRIRKAGPADLLECPERH
jgi:type IV fimbrial biogenesis protein FimT